MTSNNQKVIIMGGSSGMGLATAQLLAKEDYNVVIAGRSQSKIDAAIAQIQGNAAGFSVDFTVRDAVEQFFEKVGAFDHLACIGAGEAAWGNFPDIEESQLRSAFDAKFWGFFYSAKAALKTIRQDGSITFVTGAASRTAIPGTSGLAAVNGAIHNMGITMAKEIAPIRVNILSPGLVNTPAYDGMSASEKQEFFMQMAGSLPVGRVGEVEDIAQAVKFIISNSFLTAAVLDVDGGARLH